MCPQSTRALCRLPRAVRGSVSVQLRWRVAVLARVHYVALCCLVSALSAGCCWWGTGSAPPRRSDGVRVRAAAAPPRSQRGFFALHCWVSARASGRAHVMCPYSSGASVGAVVRALCISRRFSALVCARSALSCVQRPHARAGGARHAWRSPHFFANRAVSGRDRRLKSVAFSPA